MTERQRVRLLLPALALFLALSLCSAWNLPAWGDYRGPYGDAIARAAQYERHANDVVNAINYDYRAADTLGEEFILFTSVLGVMLLLRRVPGAETQTGKVQGSGGLSQAVRAVSVPAIWLTVMVGLYIALHGQLSPGGGFQGGVILATAAWLVYIAVNPTTFHRLSSGAAAEVIEAIGAGGYAVIGLLPLLMGSPVLTNMLPLGTTGDVFSSGTIALISACVAVEVTASFLLVSHAYLQEIIAGEVPG
jgi:multicomponent Na+:H+ antiporter subunit B